MSKKKHLFKRPDKNMPVVKVEKRMLPENSTNRKHKQEPKYIVIHEVSLGTGKSPENFNMEHYAKQIYDMGQNGRTIGYHYLVGDKELYQFIPDDEATDHTGTEVGNNSSIGVERLICKGINYEYAIHNQAKLIATLMLKYNIPISKVMTHKQMQMEFGNENQKLNPKQCPGRLISGFRGTVQDFKHEIKRCFIYGWFFEELLDEKTKNIIPQLKEIAETRFFAPREKKQDEELEI